jgi:hypothetical protein
MITDMIPRPLLLVAGVLAGYSANAAPAEDALPLKRGVYVAETVPCDGASNAATRSYWGGKNGINDQQDECRIVSQRGGGSRRVIKRSCRNIRIDGPAYRSDLAVDLRDRSAFTIEGRTYRFCRPFSPSSRP